MTSDRRPTQAVAKDFRAGQRVTIGSEALVEHRHRCGEVVDVHMGEVQVQVDGPGGMYGPIWFLEKDVYMAPEQRSMASEVGALWASDMAKVWLDEHLLPTHGGMRESLACLIAKAYSDGLRDGPRLDADARGRQDECECGASASCHAVVARLEAGQCTDYPRPGVLGEVATELERARTKFPGAQNSAHEGYAVLAEEVDELWDEVKANHPERKARMRTEAVQVAAMAIRFIEDVCDR